MKRKKITAILLASFMGISTMPATAWAADSYKETEKAAVAKAIQEFGADYAESLSQMNTEEVKGNAEMKISLDDGGKAILGMLSPVRALVFNVLLPSKTVPSIGTFSPGCTTITFPTSTSSGSTCSNSPFSFSTLA